MPSEFDRRNRIRSTKFFVEPNVFAAAAASALMSMADGRETLGLWPFNLKSSVESLTQRCREAESAEKVPSIQEE